MAQFLPTDSKEAMLAIRQPSSGHNGNGVNEASRLSSSTILTFTQNDNPRLTWSLEDQDNETMLALHRRLLTLKLLPRTGWLQRGMHMVESIAEHTFGVATLALIIGDMIPDVDRGRLLAIALLHDMAEALIGDLPVTASNLFGSEAKHKAERLAMIDLFGELPQIDEYLELWDEYTNRSSREARLVKQLDRLEMLLQALAYEQAGHRGMAEFWEGCDEGWSSEFPLVHSFAKHLIDERNKLVNRDRV
jgi:putative hydrolase of HD superfamily